MGGLGSITHLNKDQAVFILQYQVYFSSFTAVVALQQLQATCLQVFAGKVFGILTAAQGIHNQSFQPGFPAAVRPQHF